ncbi:MAG: HAD family hydrolase [Nanoarchaeota archaeon]|nr:HAD family hydrolase [Nanoarchaeota archaeon]
MIKAIIFDFDNTLEDFLTVKHKAEMKIGQYLHKKHKILPLFFLDKFDDIDMEVSHIGAVKKKPKFFDRHYWFKMFFSLARMKVSKKEIERLVHMYWGYINKNAKLLPHVKSTLNYLKGKYKIVVMSDSDGSKKIKYERIKNVGIFDKIDMIVLGEDVGVNKPHRYFYNYVFKRMKLKASECVMVGDKPEVDLKLAKKLGMKTIWMKYGSWAEQLKGKKFSYVDYTVTDFKQLRKIL